MDCCEFFVLSVLGATPQLPSAVQGTVGAFLPLRAR